MAKAKFDPDFNKEIYRTVKSFNQRAKRATARGMSNVPDIVSIAKLKSRYHTKEDMKTELARLRKMNTDPHALDRVDLGYNAHLTKWEYGYIKDSIDDVKDLYDIMLKAAKERYKVDPNDFSLKQQVANLETRRQYLDRNLSELTRSELKTMRTYINKYQDYGTRDAMFQDTFLEAFDALMNQAGTDPALMARIKEQLSTLTPEEFMEVYKSTAELKDLFNELDSPEGLKRMAYANKKAAREKLEAEMKKADQTQEARLAKWKAEGWKEDPETGQWYKPGEWVKGDDGVWVNTKNKSTWKLRDTTDNKRINQRLSQVDALLADRIEEARDRMKVKIPKGLTASQKKMYNRYKRRG